MNKYLFWGLCAAFLVSFFNRGNLAGVTTIAPPLLQQPLQTGSSYSAPIEFTRNGFAYTLTPVYTYEIAGLVVGKMDYRWFSTDKFDLVFPADLCLVWGSNAGRQLYRDPAVRFSQDCRWCWVSWSRDVGFNMNEMSNNHLLINDDRIEATVKNILRGDQVRIKGKLVNVKARPEGQPGTGPITWNTSISRTDSGAGACEVIYVEQVETLERANMAWRLLFRLSFYGLIGLVLWHTVNFFRTPRP